MSPDEILTLPEVAALLRVAEKTVYALAQKGKLPAFKVGGQWRFSRSAIESWIDERTRSGQPADPASERSSTGRAGGVVKTRPRRHR